jgi:hypothetical protein
MKLRCFSCGKSVSTTVPDNTVLRAILTCPECIEANQATTTGDSMEARETTQASEPHCEKRLFEPPSLA